MNRFPVWIKKTIRITEEYETTRQILEKHKLNTVCVHARCPNIYECFGKKYASFMILGSVCTRQCRFCSVSHNSGTSPVDPEEPEKIAEAVNQLGLRYVVITSPTRDDLADGGAKHFANCIAAVKRKNPETKIEPLIPDFKGNIENLMIVLAANPDIVSHNLETVPSLYSSVRPEASYIASLNILRHAKRNGFLTKSGIMVGLGETFDEVIGVMNDLRNIECDFFVIGQYLKSAPENLNVKEFIRPEIFEKYKKIGEKMGFRMVFSGVFCRSSYMAELAIVPSKTEKK